MALNYGKFRRYVTREEVAEWAKNFHIEALKEAKANLKGRIAEIGHIKKAWEKPVQVREWGKERWRGWGRGAGETYGSVC